MHVRAVRRCLSRPRLRRSHLLSHAAQGKYEAALREYHKGLYLYNNRPNQLLPISIPMASSGNSNSLAPPSAVATKHPDSSYPFSPIDGSGTLASPLTPSVSAAPPSASLTDAQIHARREQQRRLMGKIWNEVEKVMAEMRTRLEDGLRGDSGTDDAAGIVGADDGLGTGQRVELGIDEVEKSIE